MKILKIIFLLDVLLVAVATIILIIFAEVFFIEIINKYHTKYSSGNIINIDNNVIYYDKNKYSFNYQIMWIDNDNLIYEKDNSLYLKDRYHDAKVILKSNKTILENSIIYSDGIIYYQVFDGYKSYNTNSDSYEDISSNIYFEKKYGNKYIVESYNMSLLSLKIRNKENNKLTIINEDTLKSNSTFNIFMKYKITNRMDNYIIKDNNIYMSFFFNEFASDLYGVTFKYNMINNEIECYDCFAKENQYTNYKSFLIDNNDLWFLDLFEKI